MNKKIRKLLAFSVLSLSITAFGCSNSVKGFQSDLASYIEKVDKASKEIDYLSKDDQATLQKELKRAKEIETSTSKSQLTDETSKLKSVLRPLKEKSKSISDDIAAMTQLEKNVAVDQANKKSLNKLISESHDFSNYNTFYTSCQTALSKGRTQVIETVKNQATKAINNTYIQQSDKSNLVSILDKVKKSKDVANAFAYIDDLQSQTSKVIENTKANEAKQKAAQAKAEADKKAAQAAQAADSGNINTTASDKWAIQDGYHWQVQ